MTDIVERLHDEATRLMGRAFGESCGSPDCGLAANLATEAADTIERLRAELKAQRSAVVRECAGVANETAEWVTWDAEARIACLTTASAILALDPEKANAPSPSP